LEKLCKAEGLASIADPEDEYYYIGINVEDMDEDKTIRDVKKEAKEKIKKLFGDNADKHNVRVITDGWYNG